VLFHGWSDRRTHEWFLERDYPDEKVLAKLHGALSETPQSSSALAIRVGGDPDVFEKALEKLWIHGGASLDPAENATRGPAADWSERYLAQREHKVAQLEQMSRYTDVRGCRMLHLVRHFGDQSDDGSRCGCCDVCDPAAANVLALRDATASERGAMESVLKTLGGSRGLALGRLLRESLGEDFPRREFDALLVALSRLGLVEESEASFERDGETIRYRRIALTDDARESGLAALDRAQLVQEEAAPTRRGRRVSGAGRTRKTRRSSSSGDSGGTRSRSRSSVSLDGDSTADPRVIDALREWRLAEAKRRRTPAFRIFSNRVLLALAEASPADEDELLAISGIGPALARKYGKQLLELLQR
jgi:DNA topoisomerase-3